MTITGETKISGIFGYPVSHSISPAIHNAAFKALGLDMVYLPFEVKPSDLKHAVTGIKALGLLGVNITIPHKETVIKFLDHVSEEAAIIGAVNTIVNKDGQLIGYNTDGRGYASSLREETDFNPKDKNIVMLGSGGAARGILAALAEQKPKAIVIANRTVSRAAMLVRFFKPRFPWIKFEAAGLDKNSLEKHFEDAHLIINATSVGMKQAQAIEVPFDALSKNAIVSDIVYNPLKTALLKKAGKLSLATHSGLGMLIHQAALSFNLWTGMDAPIDVMRKAALKLLKKI